LLYVDSAGIKALKDIRNHQTKTKLTEKYFTDARKTTSEKK